MQNLQHLPSSQETNVAILFPHANKSEASWEKDTEVNLTREQVRKIDQAMKQFTKNNLSFAEVSKKLDLIRSVHLGHC